MENIRKYAGLAPVGVMRFSGKYLLRPESVTDHIVQCITICLKVASDLNELGVKVDVKDLVYRCSIHDLPESQTQDIVRPFKYHHPELTREINIAEEDMIRQYGLYESLIHDINHAKDTDTIEGAIMRWVDICQVVLKLDEEVNYLGNRLLENTLSEALRTYDKVLNKISGLYGHVFDNYIKKIKL